MAITYGFYNSLNHDRVYDARQVSSIFDGVINDGIYMSIGERFMVFPSNGMKIAVGSGRAWFYHTWTLNDTREILTVQPSDLLYNRIDTVVLEINEDLRENTIKIIKGNPSGSPVAPTLINNQSVHQIPLANIRVNKAITTISTSNIINRVGTSSAPFVTGIIQTINIDSLINQWRAEWNDWYLARTGEWQTWNNARVSEWANLRNSINTEWADWKDLTQEEYDNWIGEKRVELFNLVNTLQGDYDNFIASKQSDFNTWFNALQVSLDGDVATRLATKIEELENRWVILGKKYEYRDSIEDSNNESITASDGSVIHGRVVYAVQDN